VSNVSIFERQMLGWLRGSSQIELLTWRRQNQHKADMHGSDLGEEQNDLRLSGVK